MPLHKFIGGGECWKIIKSRTRRSTASPQIDMHLGNAKTFADRNTHAISPISVSKILRDGVSSAAGSLVLVGNWRGRHDRDPVAIEHQTSLMEQMTQPNPGKPLGGRNAQTFQSLKIAFAHVHVCTDGHEPV